MSVELRKLLGHIRDTYAGFYSCVCLVASVPLVSGLHEQAKAETVAALARIGNDGIIVACRHAVLPYSYLGGSRQRPSRC